MEIKEITNKAVWEGFLAKQEEKTFLQSWAWGEFHKKMGERVWRLGVFEGEDIVTVALVVRVGAKRGAFLMVQHAVHSNEEAFLVLLEKVKEIGREEGASFLRIASLWKRSEKNQKFFQGLGFREAPMHINAYESTWKLDITPTEDELLANMRKTTRYVVRQILKNKDIQVEKSAAREDIQMFAALNIQVARRQQFVPFSKKYIEAEFDAFSEDNAVILFLGKYRGEVGAAAIVIFWSGMGFYHQAASLDKYAKLSIPYLVQWEAIKEAKRRGCALYDFWGYVDPKKCPKHPWAGPTLFKMGFGGAPYEYVKTQDYPLSWRYWPTAVFETIRKKRRGL